MKRNPLPQCWLLAWWGITQAAFPAAPLAEWDFTSGTHGWTGNQMVAPITSTPQGLAVRSTGDDPWIEGPPFQAPATGLLRVTLEMQSDVDPVAHLFYGKTFHASRMETVSLTRDNTMHAYVVTIPESTGPGTRLRLDPCQSPGTVLVRRIRVESIQPPAAPVFDKPGLAGVPDPRHAVRAQASVLTHQPNVWNGLHLRLEDRDLAVGYDGEMLGVMIDDTVDYLKLKEGSLLVEHGPDNALVAQTVVRDRAGATWTVQRRFAPSDSGGAIHVDTTIAVDQDRGAVLLPWLTLLPGHGSFGSRKHQGLFAGLEYLADEPSSSEADLTGPAHVRRVPDPVKVTFPLMAIEQDGSYLGVVWDPSEAVAAGFDSPDRVFGSDGHALWLSGPGVGEGRFENGLAGHTPMALRASVPVTVRATLIAGRSASVMGAVKHYLSLRPLPELPAYPGGFHAAVDLLAHGWLDSAINEGWRFKHAEWMGRFGPQAAAGPALHLSWLAGQTTDPSLAARLKDGVDKTLALLPPGDPFASDVSHVRLPSAPLLFGRVPEYVAHRTGAARAQVRQFDDQGRLLYRPGEIDYGRTHFARHANGLGGRVLADVLEAAVLGADEELIHQALAVLDKQSQLYAHTVPRGAQTWEIPLHTPDILASAHMVRAYVYGFVLTGNKAFLEEARYWAWTGVPFVYLVNPSKGECGPYATIAVLGATNWKAPVWLGQPVQWCGLVYGSALHLLSQYDNSGPWQQLARGITLAGLQMTFPTTDAQRQGLLPDFFHLKRQVSDGPAINPGTVGAHLPEAFGKGTLYDFHRFRNGWVVHAPCAISEVVEGEGTIRIKLEGWGERPYRVLVAGVKVPPRDVRVGNKAAQTTHVREQQLLVIPARGVATLAIERE